MNNRKNTRLNEPALSGWVVYFYKQVKHDNISVSMTLGNKDLRFKYKTHLVHVKYEHKYAF